MTELNKKSIEAIYKMQKAIEGIGFIEIKSIDELTSKQEDYLLELCREE